MARSTHRVATVPSLLLLSLLPFGSPAQAVPIVPVDSVLSPVDSVLSPVGDVLTETTGTLTETAGTLPNPTGTLTETAGTLPNPTGTLTDTGTLPDPTGTLPLDVSCDDFESQLDAQAAFLTSGAPALDLDGDGVACEGLPGPFADTTPDPSPNGTGTSDGTTSTSGGTTGTSGATTLRQRARVLSVIDGDTIRVRLANGRRKAVQLIGINAPEVRGRIECGGRRASTSLRGLAPRRTRVVLVSDSTQPRVDRQGRLLRYVMRGRKDLNRAQVGRGWARVQVDRADPSKRVGPYRRSQRRANAQDRGIWGLCR